MDQRRKTIALLGESIGQELHDTGFDSDLLDMTPKATGNKRKKIKLDCIKITKFCA